MLKRVNLTQKLRKFKNKTQTSPNLSFKGVDSYARKRSQPKTMWFDFDLLETDRIYHLEHIKEICISYRLRFLEADYFKADFPKEAIIKIRKLESDHGTQIDNFMIIAPSRLMQLKNPDDPLLFVPMGNGYYYLIAQWGKDLSAFRKWKVLPLRSPINLIVFVVLVSLLITVLLPLHVFTPNVETQHFWILFLFIFKMILSVLVFYGIALGKNFNEVIWNSKLSKN